MSGIPDAPSLVPGSEPALIARPDLRLVETRGQACMRVKDEVKGYLEEEGLPTPG